MSVLQLNERDPNVDCMVCSDTFRGSQMVRLPCRDLWCRRCLTRQFEEATVNEGVWPPKCCRQDITLPAVFRLLPPDVRARFATKSVEWSTPNRPYCHDRTCSAFIPLDHITRVRRAGCRGCHSLTCSECKGPYHRQPPCPDTTTIEDMLLEATAKENGWARRPNSRRYVEITHGCNHMTYVRSFTYNYAS
jgi:IBR domain, a half RING-finger domain